MSDKNDVNVKVKLILTHEDGTIKEIEGEGIIFCLDHGKKVKESYMETVLETGIFGKFSRHTLGIARTEIISIIDNTLEKKGAL